MAASVNDLFLRLHQTGFQPTSEELLELIDSWELFPFWFGARIAVVCAAERSPDNIEVIIRDDPAGSERGFAVTNNAVPGCGQLALLGDGLKLPRGFQFITLRIGESTLTTPAHSLIGDNCVSVDEFALPMAHVRMEDVLKPVFEVHGLDSSTLVMSGRVCRHVCKTLDGLGPMKSRWPSCAGPALNELHEHDLAAVLAAERSIIRLRTQLETTHSGRSGNGKSKAKGKRTICPACGRADGLVTNKRFKTSTLATQYLKCDACGHHWNRPAN